jgi:hypothetical protein
VRSIALTAIGHIQAKFETHLTPAGLKLREFEMKRLFSIALALAALTPVAAQATERMTDARYVSAQRCLAYSDLSQLQGDGFDFTALREASDYGNRNLTIQTRTRETTRQVRASAYRLGSSDRAVTELRGRRDDACASFVEGGLVQHNAANTSAAR